MIHFEKFVLDNGLRLIVHEDRSTPMVAMCVTYHVGSRDENPEKTGFAHLFEHLMFGGSVNIPRYDEPLERAGGINNAYTTSDLTCYYLTLPAHNLETAFWLESDRMYQLAFSEKSLEVQKNVVSEEYRQNYLNQPYGDAWLLLRPLAYKVHPYRWPTIGKDISHIMHAELNDVVSFYNTYYNPGNAVLTVAGNLDVDQVVRLAEKWFGTIENRGTFTRSLPVEPEQTAPRHLEVERPVPANAIYKAWKMCGRLDEDYHASDLITDILGNGTSSLLYHQLVKEKKIFTSIDCFQLGTIDPGLVVVSGLLADGISLEQADQEIIQVISRLSDAEVVRQNLQKVKNITEANIVFSRINVLNKAMSLALAEIFGNADMVNTELERYHSVTPEKIITLAETIFRPEHSSTLWYKTSQTDN